MQKLLTTFLALVALAMGLSHAGAMAAGAMAAPAVVAPVAVAATVDKMAADLPCHASEGEEAAPADMADNGNTSPDCCPDGCKGGCAMLAALPGAVVAALPEALHGQTPLPVGAPAPADRPHGLKRPPRATA